MDWNDYTIYVDASRKGDEWKFKLSTSKSERSMCWVKLSTKISLDGFGFPKRGNVGVAMLTIKEFLETCYDVHIKAANERSDKLTQDIQIFEAALTHSPKEQHKRINELLKEARTERNRLFGFFMRRTMMSFIRDEIVTPRKTIEFSGSAILWFFGRVDGRLYIDNPIRSLFGRMRESEEGELPKEPEEEESDDESSDSSDDEVRF
ncbi:hypothetical protein A9K97_gp262 [Tokyovirus A1]|uniref:hypothetical protein n=1 Tax=Tokyovirus A1 TaxID=1826170 RepID=UPI0007A96EEA|nr:hypothetical protein A9K97_gp262 [Tokyovirus A1]BAU80089.1 hypothetical protein [Tokyovirus A1]